MAWIETDSLSFTARHDDADPACAHRVLDALEDLRLRLEDRFDRGRPATSPSSSTTTPPGSRRRTRCCPRCAGQPRPPARRYLAGWPMDGEIHVLNDSWMERRSAGEDSLRALRGTAERMYCQLVLAANNPALPPMWTPRRFLTYLRWAWLIEGAAQYFTGQISFFRAAVITRLREGERPRLPAHPPRRADPRRHDLRPARPPRRAGGLRPDGRAAAPRGPAGQPRARLRGAHARRSSAPGACTWTRSSTGSRDSAASESLSDVLERPDARSQTSTSTSAASWSFDPSTERRPRTSPPGQRSAEREIEELDDQGGNSHRRDQPQREPRRRPDPR